MDDITNGLRSIQQEALPDVTKAENPLPLIKRGIELLKDQKSTVQELHMSFVSRYTFTSANTGQTGRELMPRKKYSAVIEAIRALLKNIERRITLYEQLHTVVSKKMGID